MTQKTRRTGRVPATQRKPKFVVDEVRVQVIVREVDANGETVAKQIAEPLVFVNERAFREWAAKPFNFNDQRLDDRSDST